MSDFSNNFHVARRSLSPAEMASSGVDGVDFVPGEQAWSQAGSRPIWRNSSNDGWVDGSGAVYGGPTVTGSQPGDGDTGVPKDAGTVHVTFSYPLDPETVKLTSFVLSINHTPFTQIGTNITISSDNRTISIDYPTLAALTEYKVHVTTDVLDFAGQPIDEVVQTFTTEA